MLCLIPWQDVGMLEIPAELSARLRSAAGENVGIVEKVEHTLHIMLNSNTGGE